MQICSKLEIILTFSRKCLFYRIFTLLNFTLQCVVILVTFTNLLGMCLQRLWTWFSMRSSHFASQQSTQSGQSGFLKTKEFFNPGADQKYRWKQSSILFLWFNVIFVFQRPIFHHLSWGGISRGVFWYFGKVSMDSLSWTCSPLLLIIGGCTVGLQYPRGPFIHTGVGIAPFVITRKTSFAAFCLLVIK